MNTEKAQNIKKSETDSSISVLLALANLIIGLLSIMNLGLFHSLLRLSTDSILMVERLHGNILSEFATRQCLYISNATLWIFVIALIALCISFILKRTNNRKLAHLFLMLTTGINVVAGLFFLLAVFLWTPLDFAGKPGDLIFYGVLLTLGIAALVWGLFYHKTDDEIRMKKWIPITITGFLIIATVFCAAYPFVAHGAEYKEMNTLRQTIVNQKTGFNEEIAYQIGNYINRDAIYIEDKLYLIKYNETTDAEEILSIDRSGNQEVLWTDPNNINKIGGYLYHYEGCLYVLANNRGTPFGYDRLLRISMADGKVETLLESENDFWIIGIRDNLLLIHPYDYENPLQDCIYAYDLSKPITQENGYLYDYYVGYIIVTSFVNHYLYGDNTCPYYGTTGDPTMCINDTYYMNYEGYLCRYDSDGRTVIDDYALSSNIFNNQLYYIKYSENSENYEVYTSTLTAENKKLIGTMPAELFTNCYNMSVAEDFLIFYDGELETKAETAYLMWMDDGSYEKLW